MIKEVNWDRILGEVSKKVGQQEFRAWLEPTKLLKIRDGKIHISAPTQFHCDWINDHFKELVQRIALDMYHEPLELVPSSDGAENTDLTHVDRSVLPNNIDAFSSDAVTSGDRASTNSAVEGQNKHFADYCEYTPPHNEHGGERKGPASVNRTQSKHGYESINQHNTFDNFVVGASNQFAHAACRAVAEFPASQYNPLFIHSNAGLGKTHLLHAIANYFLQVNPSARICFLSAETFANELIESIRNQKTMQFRQKYRDSYDMLLLDDFQFIAGKISTQEEFFHTFNALHQSGRQIVVTSDKSPNEIPGLEERIRTRFECGLIADIQPPEIETRIAILREKAEQDDIFMPEDVALFLATNIKSNIRELEGVLIQLEAQASLNGVEISLELAKKQLVGRIKEPIFAVSTDVILNAVARHFSVRVADLKSKDRSRKFSLPRQITMWFLRRYTQKSTTEIGLCLGGKDHSTVIYGINSITNLMETDAAVQKYVQDIQNLL